MLAQSVFHDRQEHVCRLDDSATEHDDFRIERIHKVRETEGNPIRERLHHRQRIRITASSTPRDDFTVLATRKLTKR